MKYNKLKKEGLKESYTHYKEPSLSIHFTIQFHKMFLESIFAEYGLSFQFPLIFAVLFK